MLLNVAQPGHTIYLFVNLALLFFKAYEKLNLLIFTHGNKKDCNILNHFQTSSFYSLLLVSPHFSSLLLIVTHCYSLLLIVTHCYSLLLIDHNSDYHLSHSSVHHCSSFFIIFTIFIIVTHCYSLLLIVTHRYSLLLISDISVGHCTKKTSD